MSYKHDFMLSFSIFRGNRALTQELVTPHETHAVPPFALLRPLELTANGCNTKAYELLLDYTFPSWLYQITNGGAIYNGAGNYGATTLWERRNGWVSGAGGGTYGPSSENSLNHFWTGEVGEWAYRTLGGINPDDSGPGFQNVVIRPQPPLPGGPITNSWASFSSIHGLITTSWSCSTNASSTNLVLAVTLPANTMARICLPTTNLVDITEGGMAATNSAGLFYFQVTNGMAVFGVGSGSYNLSVSNIHF
jgi:alpha-L-rhamnosidase